jgi:hypothetical protein
MKAPKVIVTGVLASLFLGTAVQAADYPAEPYAEVEPRYHNSRVIEVPQERPLSSRVDEERAYHGPRYLEEERVYDRPVPGWRPWSRPVAARPWQGPGSDCRVIIKRRENAWGEITVRRIRVCD